MKQQDQSMKQQDQIHETIGSNQRNNSIKSMKQQDQIHKKKRTILRQQGKICLPAETTTIFMTDFFLTFKTEGIMIFLLIFLDILYTLIQPIHFNPPCFQERLSNCSYMDYSYFSALFDLLSKQSLFQI